MKPNDRVAVVTGAGSGIGKAVAVELAHRGARAVAAVDRSESVREVASEINHAQGRQIVHPFVGDTTDPEFRRHVYDQIGETGRVSICVPAAGVTRDALAVKVDKQTGKVVMYPESQFRQVVEVNLIAPTYWAMEMVARVAEDRHRHSLKRWDPSEKIQGVAIFIGSVSSQGNKGQIAYAATKRGLEGVASTLMKEAMFYGVRCAVIHPGFTDTPMVRAMGDKLIDENILPYTQLRRLIRPEEIAEAICFMISNEAVSGELWADAGWHPSA